MTKLWIDNPQYKTGPLYDCMLDKLKSWKFVAYAGEQAKLSLKIPLWTEEIIRQDKDLHLLDGSGRIE